MKEITTKASSHHNRTESLSEFSYIPVEGQLLPLTVSGPEGLRLSHSNEHHETLTLEDMTNALAGLITYPILFGKNGFLGIHLHHESLFVDNI